MRVSSFFILLLHKERLIIKDWDVPLLPPNVDLGTISLVKVYPDDCQVSFFLGTFTGAQGLELKRKQKDNKKCKGMGTVYCIVQLKGTVLLNALLLGSDFFEV